MSGLGITDVVVFVATLVMSLGVGLWSTFRSTAQPSVSEYLLGGRRIPVAPVAVSLLGGVVSALSILGNASEIYLYGTQLTLNLGGVMLGALFISVFFVPTIYNVEIVSIMQYLELRYSSSMLRKMATACQLLSMSFYLGICLYAPSLALSSVTPLPTWASITIMGLVCTVYVSLGGVRAVVYTDVVQTVLMFLGMVVVVAKCVVDLGGFSNLWATAEQGHRLEFFNLDPSPFVRHTVWTTISLGIYFSISTVGLSQAQFQRFASVRTEKQRQFLLIIFSVGVIIMWGLFYLSGLVAYATYSNCDPLASGQIEKGDQIIPYMVMDKLRAVPGVAGLFVAAVYGGVLSSMSSQANSIACLCWEDLLKEARFFRSLSPEASTRCVKLLSAASGLMSVGVALLAGNLGSLFNVAYGVVGAIRGPIDGLFLAGLFLPWANTTGATAGLVVSFTCSMWLVVGKMLRGGGSPPHLPLSTEGCNATTFTDVITFINATTHLTDATSLVATNTTLTNATSFVTTPLSVVSATEAASVITSQEYSLYDLSYCYSGIMGIIITMIVCSFVSLCTGPLAPGKIPTKLVNSSCASLYRWLWLRWTCRPSNAPDSGTENGAPNPATSASPHHKEYPELSLSSYALNDIENNQSSTIPVTLTSESRSVVSSAPEKMSNS